MRSTVYVQYTYIEKRKVHNCHDQNRWKIELFSRTATLNSKHLYRNEHKLSSYYTLLGPLHSTT